MLLADPARRAQRVLRAGRPAARLRTRQRAGVRAADDGGAGRRRPGGRRRGVRAGERHAAGGRLARAGRAGHRLRHREQARAGPAPPGLSPAEAARHVFVVAADKSFWTATIFLVATWLLVAFAIKTASRSRSSGPAECPGARGGVPARRTPEIRGTCSSRRRRPPLLPEHVLGAEAEHRVVPDLGVGRREHPVVLAGQLQEAVRHRRRGRRRQPLTRSHHSRSASLTGTR